MRWLTVAVILLAIVALILARKMNRLERELKPRAQSITASSR